ncbi:holo-ACP synthase [Paenibacillus apis]|uniref:Holo-[acyl-carrier-protein] synthase n=1 Tax=Paenibacillus apis TaxID=1792174 RepID=A0A919Y924_9BACL|nr:holo-ACP synthase [Paenibacillus apis]GIO44302.1 holo-[acyl-carrier-protein] synthase [Paenibacillus apis]
MIYGIGNDMVEIERVHRMLQGRSGERLRERVLTLAERELPGSNSRPAEFLAGRFAAKEAVSKAFGCGIGKILSFQDIRIMPGEHGKPLAFLSEEAWIRLGMQREQTCIHISITHERKLAAAFAVIEVKNGV